MEPKTYQRWKNKSVAGADVYAKACTNEEYYQLIGAPNHNVTDIEHGYVYYVDNYLIPPELRWRDNESFYKHYIEDNQEGVKYDWTNIPTKSGLNYLRIMLPKTDTGLCSLHFYP